MDGVSLLNINDRPIPLKHLCIDGGKLKWFGNFKDLKLECSAGLCGRWTSPGGNTKKFVYVKP